MDMRRSVLISNALWKHNPTDCPTGIHKIFCNCTPANDSTKDGYSETGENLAYLMEGVQMTPNPQSSTPASFQKKSHCQA